MASKPPIRPERRGPDELGELVQRVREADTDEGLRELLGPVVERARTDSLTGLAHRGRFWDVLEVEVQRAARYGRGLAVVLLDLDGFKQVNDRLGHLAGDAALAGVGALLGSLCRSSDLAARYGGEEFAVLLPETSARGAASFAEKIRSALAAAPPAGVVSEPVTASVGVSVYPKDARSPRDLVATADRRLYRAKAEGGNRVVSADREAAAAP